MWREEISAEILGINMALENHYSVYYITSIFSLLFAGPEDKARLINVWCGYAWVCVCGCGDEYTEESDRKRKKKKKPTRRARRLRRVGWDGIMSDIL